jgi:hypothetical protein
MQTTRFGAVIGMALVVALLLGAPASAAGQSADSSAGLVGSWLVEVTLRDCTTNQPMGSFASLVTFHRGGTVNDSTSAPAFAIGQRTLGHGVWSHLGAQTYRQEMAALILFSTAPNLPALPGYDPSKPITPGFQAGLATVSHTVTLQDATHLSSVGTNAFYDTSGSQYRSGCSTATGQRFP